jgi:branched-chain amino acid transport system permease protein
MEILVQTLADGLVIGAFYSLIALGYTMVFGIIKLLNFAHGDLYMLGAFVGYSLLSVVSGNGSGAGLMGIAVVLLLTMAIVGAIGMGIERVAYRPLLLAPRLSILITALGVSLSGIPAAALPRWLEFVRGPDHLHAGRAGAGLRAVDARAASVH